MYKIQIGGSEKELSEVSESWISHQVQERRHDGQPVCVRISLKNDCIDMILATPQCGGGGGGVGRQPKCKESEIFALWNDRHLNQNDWAVGNLIAFLKQLRRLI
jgi:hypothetical protein